MPLPPASPNWRKLLRIGYRLLDQARLVDKATFGGGSALALRYDHRLSWDVDIFLSDPQYLSLLSPRLNDEASNLVELSGGSYVEQSNFLKLAFPDGEIDFIVAPLLTEPGAKLLELEGYDVRVEEPEEIIAKKLTYRGGGLLKLRDVFDMIAVCNCTPALFKVALAHARFDMAATRKRLEDIDGAYLEDIKEAVTPTELGRSWMAIPAARLLDFLSEFP